jgi:hypothetical protein
MALHPRWALTAGADTDCPTRARPAGRSVSTERRGRHIGSYGVTTSRGGAQWTPSGWVALGADEVASPLAGILANDDATATEFLESQGDVAFRRVIVGGVVQAEAGRCE